MFINLIIINLNLIQIKEFRIFSIFIGNKKNIRQNINFIHIKNKIMDFSQLLNTSTDFDQNKLALLEQLITILYSTSTNHQDVSTSNLLIIKFLL